MDEHSEAEEILKQLSSSIDRRKFLGLTGAASLGAFLPSSARAGISAMRASATPVTWAKPPVNFLYLNTAEPNSLDPAVTTLNNSYDTVRNVYDPLVWVDELHGKLVPWLAESFSSSANGRTHTFHIRDGVFFHDGSKLNAHVVALNMERYLKVNLGNAYLISDIGRVTAVGPRTVEITTQRPDVWFPAHLAKFPIISAKAILANRTATDPWAKDFFNTNMVGTGAYRFGGWQHGVQITLNKYTHWWRGWRPGSIDNVIIKSIGQAATMVELIQSGQADFSTQWAIGDALATAKMPGFSLLGYKSSTTSPIIYMNTSKPPLNNVLVRRALVAAFDYHAMAQFFEDRSTPSGGPLPPFYSGADHKLPVFKQDLAKARALLSQAGVDPQSITINYMAESDQGTTFPAAAAIAQASFEALGVKVNIARMPYAQILAAYNNPNTAGDMLAINLSPYTLDPSIFLAPFLPNYVHANFYNLQMPTVIKLMNEIQAEGDPKKSKALLVKVQDAIVANAPAIFGAVPQLFIPIRDYIHGYVLQASDFRYPTLLYLLRIAKH